MDEQTVVDGSSVASTGCGRRGDELPGCGTAVYFGSCGYDPDWKKTALAPTTPENRHFLFYFRDNTFECFAREWRFERSIPAK